jgi:phosphoribosylformylglycinamidine cyclo-ligase
MSQSVTYKDAGVDIDLGNNLVERIKGAVKSTHRPEVLSSIGGFAGCFAPNMSGMQEPVLVSATDGVGTKLKLAIENNSFDGIGIDLVAMCVNDLIVMGAEPLFFLDYYASGKLEADIAEQVITGIANGCKIANTALIGGETAEMPGMYQNKDFDLAGFCVGIVDKSKIIDGSNIQPGDQLIALASSGLHANGFSLVRKLLEHNQPSSDFINNLLTPTKIYVKTILALAKKNLLKGCAHITGGGFSENIPRILPPNYAAQIDLNSWQMPQVFNWLQQKANLEFNEFQRTFNCGVGMICCVKDKNVEQTLEIAKQNGDSAWLIGSIIHKSKHGVEFLNA